MSDLQDQLRHIIDSELSNQIIDGCIDTNEIARSVADFILGEVGRASIERAARG